MPINDHELHVEGREAGDAVVEIRHLREALRRAEDVLHAVFDASPVALLLLQEGMAIARANRESERLTGYPRREMEGGMGLGNLAPPQEFPALNHYYTLRRDAPDSVARRFDFSLVDRNGTRRSCTLCIDGILGTSYCLASVLNPSAGARVLAPPTAPAEHTVVVTPEPQREAILQAKEAFQKELSAKGRLESDLRAMEKRLSEVLSFFPEATYLVDEKGRVIAWNPGMEALTGAPAAEVMGKDDHAYALQLCGIRCPTLIDLALGCDAEIKNLYTTVQEEDGGWRGEMELPVANGASRHLLAKAAPLYDHQGRVCAAIETLRDITAEKGLQIKIAELQSQLTESERRVNVSVARIPFVQPQPFDKEGAGFLIDESGMIRGVSERFMKLLCRSRMELLGKKLFDFVESDCHAQLQAAIRNALMDTPNRADIRLIGKPAPSQCEIKLSRMYLNDQRLLLAFMREVNGKPSHMG